MLATQRSSRTIARIFSLSTVSIEVADLLGVMLLGLDAVVSGKLQVNQNFGPRSMLMVSASPSMRKLDRVPLHECP